MAHGQKKEKFNPLNIGTGHSDDLKRTSAGPMKRVNHDNRASRKQECRNLRGKLY